MKLKVLLIAFLAILCNGYSQEQIAFTFVPIWGSNQDLTGIVNITDPADHYVAVYIFVEEAAGFWNKPYANTPKTLINQITLTWTCDITTGGIDEFATRIFAVLLPVSTNPPIILGGELPDSLMNYPHCVVARPHGDKQINWSGQIWTVKRSVNDLRIGPGNNLFSDNDSNVFIDQDGNLHLKIVRSGMDWYCSEVIGSLSQGYGTYKYKILGRVDTFIWQTAAGFTWDDISKYAPVNPNPWNREIDIEFSKWGDPGSDLNAQFVIQPWYVTGNQYRFHIDLSSTDTSFHQFKWEPNKVSFKSIWKDSSTEWINSSLYVPVPGCENFRFNLWINSPNTTYYAAEMIINNFSFTPWPPVRLYYAGEKDLKIFCYPNPAGSDETFKILLNNRNIRCLKIFNLCGQIIKTFSQEEIEKGEILWNGHSVSGSLLPPGIYILSADDGEKITYQKLVRK